MRVLYLLGSLNIGGAEKLVLDVFRTNKNNDLCLHLAHRKGGLLLKDFQNLHIPLHHLDPRSFWKYFLRLRAIIKKEKISIVHAHQVIDAILAYIVLVGTPTKLVFTLHGHGIHDSFIQKALRKFILKQTDVNTYVSNSLRNYYFNKHKIKSGKNEVVYNGISFPKTKNGIKSKQLQIGMVGNFTAVRDHATICRFLNLLEKENVDFNFVFVGAKSNTEHWLYDDCLLSCSELVSKGKVTFLGTRKDVPNILASLDCFIYSSDHDTFGIAVVEAMAMGVPVFVNDWEVMREITNDGEWATIYKSKDEYDLLSKIISFLAEPAIYLEKAKKSASHVRELYSIESHLSKLEMIYKSII
jgi:glycosyltransferase involved in cell wall biosynthesis